MRLSKKHEQGLQAAYDLLSDIESAFPLEEERERIDLACDALHEILTSSRKQKAKDRQKRAFERRRKERAKERENSCL